LPARRSPSSSLFVAPLSLSLSALPNCRCCCGSRRVVVGCWVGGGVVVVVVVWCDASWWGLWSLLGCGGLLLKEAWEQFGFFLGDAACPERPWVPSFLIV